jgi:hypothetical protein
MAVDFAKFLTVFPPEAKGLRPMDGEALAKAVTSRFRLPVPAALRRFWSEVGWGYFGDRTLYVFGEPDFCASGSGGSDGPMPRDSLLGWNGKDFWDDIAKVFPMDTRRPFYFAETFDGVQLGHRYEAAGDRYTVELFVVDTFQAFVAADSFEELFRDVLVERAALGDPEHTGNMLRRLGPLPDGMHYAPIVSPLIGGTTDPANHHFETPNVHFRTSLATYLALFSMQKP